VASNRRAHASADRRRIPRGGRRDYDRAGRHPTVLVADSYEDARSPIARYLDRFGFDVLEASSAGEAADLLARRRPQAMLSGLQGAEADQLYELLAARPPHVPPIVILMLSSGDDARPPQATGTLAKPFSLRPMLEKLRRELRAHPLEDLPGRP
jgi:DNA-binding response OmpR family regulator